MDEGKDAGPLIQWISVLFPERETRVPFPMGGSNGYRDPPHKWTGNEISSEESGKM